MLTEKPYERKEVLYKGYLYDVTKFIHKHPGGNIIKFYTEAGEDASEAIDQFHFRSKTRQNIIMESLLKRPAPTNIANDQQTQMSLRHQELTKDFATLFTELKTEGYFEPSYSHIFLRYLEPVCILFVFMPLFLQTESFVLKFLLSMPLGFAVSRFGWIQHEGGHRSLTGNPNIDKYLQHLAMCFVLSGSSVFWNLDHNQHHAMPQRLNHDVDLGNLPFVAFNERVVSKGSTIPRVFLKYQGILYWTVDIYLFMFASKFFLHPKEQLKQKAYFEMLLNIPSYFFMFHIGIGWYFFILYWVFLILSVSFSLSHSILEVTDEPRHWVEYALLHTADITQTPLCDWWMGYLNYQIEHHLFPTMPQFRSKEVSHRVKALADKYGLPYRVFGYGDAAKQAFTNLYQVGKALGTKGGDQL